MNLEGAKIRNIYNLCADVKTDNDATLNIVIPYYQRPYIWSATNDDDSGQIEKLVRDFDENKNSKKGKNKSKNLEYFVGSVIFAYDKSGTKAYEIVDGQQRLTTTFLTSYLYFLLLRLYVDELISKVDTLYINTYFDELIKIFDILINKNSKKTKKMIACKDKINGILSKINPTQSEKSNEKFKNAALKEYRKFMCINADTGNYAKDYMKGIEDFLSTNVDLSFEYKMRSYNDNLAEALCCVVLGVNNTKPDFSVAGSYSNYNVKSYVSAMEQIYNSVLEYAGNNFVDLLSYYNLLLQNLKFCVISTQDINDAYTLFEVLNDRSAEIDDLDLIKNNFFKYYSTKSKDSDKVIEGTIDKANEKWLEVFPNGIIAKKKKLISFLGASYLTGDSHFNFNDISKFRNSIKNNHLDKFDKSPYSSEKLLMDITIYKLISILLDKADIRYSNVLDNSLAFQINSTSITFKTINLLCAYKWNGILPSLVNYILKTFFNNVYSGDFNSIISEFESFIGELERDNTYLEYKVDKKDKTKEYRWKIHKLAFELWKMTLLSDNFAVAIDFSNEIVANVNYHSGKSLKDYSISSSDYVKLKGQFLDWTNNWEKDKNTIKDNKIKILFVESYIYKRSKDKKFLLIDNKSVPKFPLGSQTLDLDHIDGKEKTKGMKAYYFEPDLATDRNSREYYINRLGNFVILVSATNRSIKSEPAYDRVNFYVDKINTYKSWWLINDLDAMIKNKKYIIVKPRAADSVNVVNAEFFNERKARLQNWFYSLLSDDRNLGAEKIPIKTL